MKTKYYIYKLKPDNKSGFHIGQYSAGHYNLESSDEIIHSDTLYSAIYSVWKYVYNDDNIEELILANNFVLSSCFHYYNNILFFPKILKRVIEVQNEEKQKEGSEISRIKELKRIQYISEKIFRKMINGEKVNLLENKIINKKYCCEKEEEIPEDEIIIKRGIIRRTSVDRISSESNLFSIEEIYFNENCGFYFLAKFNKAEIKSKFEKVLEILGEYGIGADKSSGKGKFKILEEREIEFEITDGAKHITNLSLFVPNKEKIKELLDDSRYELIERGGWCSTEQMRNLLKKNVMMFKEGSIFTNVGDEGKIVNVTPEIGKGIHNVYRIGKSINIPVLVEN